MEILILLIPLSVAVAFAIGFAFWWSAQSGQFDDLEGPGDRILMDDDKPPDTAVSDDRPLGTAVSDDKPPGTAASDD